jgi:hypothetical protein
MKKEGYLFVDHSASPGLPEDVARAAGYDPVSCREGKKYETATLTCAHCRVSVVKNPFRQRERYSCFKCGYHYICDFCAAESRKADYDHAPFEKLVANGLKSAPIFGTHTMGSPSDSLLLGVKRENTDV